MKEQDNSAAQAYGFIITKPLQLLVALAIIDQLSDVTTSDLLLVDAFLGAKDITKKLTDSHQKWRRASFFKNHEAAYKHCRRKKYDRVFVDSDVGLRKNIDLIRLKLPTLKTRICVYEEGVGSYRSDLYYGLKKKLLTFVGAGTCFGGNWLTKDIYLYCPSEYTSKFPYGRVSVVQIKISITNLIHKYDHEFDSLFDLGMLRTKLTHFASKEVCDIYLTSWSWDDGAMKRLAASDSCRIVKFHPHIKTIPPLLANGFDVSVPSSIPAELLIAAAAAMFKRVRVMHHGSSVTRYLDIRNVEFIVISLTDGKR